MNHKHRTWLAATGVALAAVAMSAGSARAGGLLDVTFDAGNFGAARNIDNPYWPLAPGMAARTFIYLTETEDGCAFDKTESRPTMVKVFTAPPYDVIVPMVVVDRVWELEVECAAVLDELAGDRNWEPVDGLGEWTDDWYAQDGYGNIWYLGEASRDFGDAEIGGEQVACPTTDEVPFGAPRGSWPEIVPGSDDLFLACTMGSWEAGQPGQAEGQIIGRPGIVVPGDAPFGAAAGTALEPGNYWMQEVAENAEDMAKALRLGAALSVDDADYEQCRKVKEWNPFDHGPSIEHKWYCADGPGLVLIEAVGGGPTELETLVLFFAP